MNKSKRTALYRHFDASGELLYVGISLNTVARTQQHAYGALWFEQIKRIEIEWHANRPAAEAAEVQAIRSELPLHNIAHADSRDVDALCPVTRPEWATNEVRCRGDALGRELWRGRQWSVTDHGVEARDGTYFICRSRLYEGIRDPHSGWEFHMAEKSWVDTEDFSTAMRIGRSLYPRGTRRARIECEDAA